MHKFGLNIFEQLFWEKYKNSGRLVTNIFNHEKIILIKMLTAPFSTNRSCLLHTHTGPTSSPRRPAVPPSVPLVLRLCRRPSRLYVCRVGRCILFLACFISRTGVHRGRAWWGHAARGGALPHWLPPLGGTGGGTTLTRRTLFANVPFLVRCVFDNIYIWLQEEVIFGGCFVGLFLGAARSRLG